MKRLGIVAVGLALVVGIVVGGMVGNPFGRSAPASAAGVGGRIISLGTVNLPPGDPHEFAIVDVRDCASLYVMYQASDTCTIDIPSNRFWSSPDGSTRVGQVYVSGVGGPQLDGHSTVSAQVVEHPPYVQPLVNNACGITTNVTGWLWCATVQPMPSAASLSYPRSPRHQAALAWAARRMRCWQARRPVCWPSRCWQHCRSRGGQVAATPPPGCDVSRLH